MTLVVQVKALAWLRRSSTTFIRPLCLNCMSGLRRPLQRAGLWRRIVEQEDRLLLRQSVVSADLVVFRPKIKTLLWFLTLFGSGVHLSSSILRGPLAFATKCSECRFGCISSKNHDFVVILNHVWQGGNTFISLTFIDHFTGNRHGSPMMMQPSCLSSSKKLIIGAFKCLILYLGLLESWRR